MVSSVPEFSITMHIRTQSMNYMFCFHNSIIMVIIMLIMTIIIISMKIIKNVIMMK